MHGEQEHDPAAALSSLSDTPAPGSSTRDTGGSRGNIATESKRSVCKALAILSVLPAVRTPATWSRYIHRTCTCVEAWRLCDGECTECP